MSNKGQIPKRLTLSERVKVWEDAHGLQVQRVLHDGKRYIVKVVGYDEDENTDGRLFGALLMNDNYRGEYQRHENKRIVR